MRYQSTITQGAHEKPRLEAFGVRLLFDPEAHPLPTPNLGPASRDLFPWQALRQEFAKLAAQ